MCNAYKERIDSNPSLKVQTKTIKGMTDYMALKSRKEGEEERRNRSKPCLESFPARTKLDWRSSRFEHSTEERAGKLASVRTKLACARIVTP